MNKNRLFYVVISVFFISFLSLVSSTKADWTPADRLTWLSGDQKDSSVATDSFNNIHVVWEDQGDDEIYYKKGTAGGLSWTSAKRLTWMSSYSENPAIAIDSNNYLHVVWHDFVSGRYEIYYKQSTDGGNNWTSAKRLTWMSGSSMHPVIGIDQDDNIHVVWSDATSGNYEIYYKKSVDGGNNWTSAKRLTWMTNEDYYPAIALESNEPNDHIHVVWQSGTAGTFEIYYKRSTDGGNNWSSADRLTWMTGNSAFPSIAVRSNDIHVVWGEEHITNNMEIYYKNSPNGGLTWTTARRLTWWAGWSSMPVIAIDSNYHLHVVWEDGSSTSYEIYYKQSPDAGVTWEAATRLTWIPGVSSSPAMAIDHNDLIHIIWQDGPAWPEDLYEIYYKNGP